MPNGHGPRCDNAASGCAQHAAEYFRLLFLQAHKNLYVAGQTRDRQPGTSRAASLGIWPNSPRQFVCCQNPCLRSFDAQTSSSVRTIADHDSSLRGLFCPLRPGPLNSSGKAVRQVSHLRGLVHASVEVEELRLTIRPAFDRASPGPRSYASVLAQDARCCRKGAPSSAEENRIRIAGSENIAP